MSARPDLLDVLPAAPRRAVRRNQPISHARRDATTAVYKLATSESDAICAQVPEDEFWFPEVGASTSTMARRVCYECPLYEPCLDYALANDVAGFWAGTTPNERKELRKARRLKAKAVTFAPWLRDEQPT